MSVSRLAPFTGIQNPNELTNEMIQQIGEAYLKAHGKKRNCFAGFIDALLHTHHDIAFAMKNYNEHSSPYYKWRFLAACYSQLVNCNGELSQHILQLFNTFFPQKLPTYNLIHDHVNHTLDEDDEVELDPLDVARSLETLIDSHYIQELRTRIKHLPYAPHDLYPTTNENVLIINPDTISSMLIRRMGESELKQKSNLPDPCLFHFFKSFPTIYPNQKTAHYLKNCPTNLDAYDLWIYLAKSYAALPKSKGELSEAILKKFFLAFGRSVYTHIRSDRQTMHSLETGRNHYYSPEIVAEALIGIVNHHYAPRYLAAIQKQQERMQIEHSVSALQMK